MMVKCQRVNQTKVDSWLLDFLNQFMNTDTCHRFVGCKCGLLVCVSHLHSHTQISPDSGTQPWAAAFTIKFEAVFPTEKLVQPFEKFIEKLIHSLQHTSKWSKLLPEQEILKNILFIHTKCKIFDSHSFLFKRTHATTDRYCTNAKLVHTLEDIATLDGETSQIRNRPSLSHFHKASWLYSTYSIMWSTWGRMPRERSCGICDPNAGRLPIGSLADPQDRRPTPVLLVVHIAALARNAAMVLIFSLWIRVL